VPLKFEPGTAWSYSCGPFVLGLLIEKLSGESYPEFMARNIFAPLGMTHTSVIDVDKIVPGRASGYARRDGVLVNGTRIAAAALARADVGIQTTAHDLAIWDAALDGNRLLSATSRQAMFSPGHVRNGDAIPYGLGWFITPFRGHREIAHSGGFRTGFSSSIDRFPDDSLTIIVLANFDNGHAYSISRGIAAIFDAAYQPIPAMIRHPETDGGRAVIVKRILEALHQGNMTPDLVPGAVLRGVYTLPEIRDLLANAGVPDPIGCRRISTDAPSLDDSTAAATCFYRIPGSGQEFWSFNFTADNRVAYFEPEQ
jgi:hypothetical protein